MKHELNITKGEWKSQQQKSGDIHISAKGWRDFIKVSFVHDINTEERRRECLFNSRLILDAGNTYQSCGLTPAQLLKQRDDLKSALNRINQMSRNGSDFDAVIDMKKIAREALKNCE